MKLENKIINLTLFFKAGTTDNILHYKYFVLVSQNLAGSI